MEVKKSKNKRSLNIIIMEPKYYMRYKNVHVFRLLVRSQKYFIHFAHSSLEMFIKLLKEGN